MDSFRAAENTDSSVTFVWDPVETAAYYNLYLDGTAYRCDNIETCTYTFTGLDGVHRFSIEAMNAEDVRLTGSETLSLMTFRENFRVRLTDSTVYYPRGLGINLRSLLGEPHNGHAVVQGGCTDGTYAYYLMVSSKTQQGRVLKTRLGTGDVVKTSGIIDVHHGNGMTYDSRRNKLVVVARDQRKQELTVIDADSLTVTRQDCVRYSNYAGAKHGSLAPIHQEQGLAAIAYSPKYDVYLALEREYHNILIFDPDTFEAKGIVFTTIKQKYPGTYQAMDADDRYVYLLLSYYSSAQPYNMIIALDWNSENLLSLMNDSTQSYVQNGWYCNNNGSGTPDAAIRINTQYEAENIFHVSDSTGRAHFYLSEYYNNPAYKEVTEQEAYQVKWKKVKKKVKVKVKYKKKVKWKKKANGKWKYKKVTAYKYKWKKKKVWKYKTKYRDVTKTVLSHYRRDNYVYDLGTF